MRPSRLLVVLALIAVAGCGGSHAPKAGGGTGTTSGPDDAQTFTVHGNDDDQFVPQTITARVGTVTLTLRNGGVPHNLTFQDRSLHGIGVVSGAQSKSTTVTFDRPGTYAFVCTIHPGMDGKVVVGG